MKRKIAAIVAADIAGYSRLVSEDEEETLTRLESLRAVFDDFVHRFGGRIFNKAGDAILAEFSSAVDATRCAIDIQESMRTRNLAYQPSRRMELRIGITIGDVVERDGDLLGDGVNIAARLESLAEPGGICVSRSVYESVANKLSVPFLDIGQQEVKNIPQPVHAFRVEWKNEPRRRTVLSPKPERRGTSALATIALAVVAAGAAAAVAILLTPRLIQHPAEPSPPTPIASAPVVEPPAPVVATTPPPVATQPSTPAPGPTITQPAAPTVAQPTPPTDPAEAFALLARQGGIVQNAASAPEHYHNARSYEMRGEALAARQSYLAFARLDLDIVDPLLRFAALLRVQEGRAGAREVFAAFAEQKKAPAFRLVHALQFDGPERLKRIEDFLAANPAYAPGYSLLADEFSESRLGGQQTIADMRKESAALQRFLDSDRQGALQAFFLDHSVIGDWVERARKRLAALDQRLEARLQRPNVNFMRHNTGWNITVQLPEAATSFSWRMGAGDFRNTGAASMIDPRTGKPAPITWFEIPGETEQAAIEVRYEDATGHMNGPFPILFDWRAAIVESQKQILEQFSSSWVQFGKGGPRDDLIYFTHLASYRCAIAKAEIGFDGAAPSRELPLPPCDRRDPLSIPSDAQTYLRVAASVKSASVKLTYADGAQSPVATFERP